MKRYRVGYLFLKPIRLTGISKSGKWDGVRISFYENGKKCWQNTYKNNFRNGIEKWLWFDNSKVWYFINFKKNKMRGIRISSK